MSCPAPAFISRAHHALAQFVDRGTACGRPGTKGMAIRGRATADAIVKAIPQPSPRSMTSGISPSRRGSSIAKA